MTKRTPVFEDKQEVWPKLAAPLATSALEWRQDGKPTTKDGKTFARFVAYVEAGTVRERLDEVVPGEWDLSLDLLPPREIIGEGGVVEPTRRAEAWAFKARLQVMGVLREDVGFGKDVKQASTDAFKRAAVRFGIGHELYSMPHQWLRLDSDSKYAKPIEDPKLTYERKLAGQSAPKEAAKEAAKGAPKPEPQPETMDDRRAANEARSAAAGMNDDDAPAAPVEDDPDAVSCPKCGGRMWDNRLNKRNPKAPDYACRDRACGGVIWPSKKPTTQIDALEGQGAANVPVRARTAAPRPPEPPLSTYEGDDDDLPF